MNEHLDEAYFLWLSQQVAHVEGFWQFLRQLHSKEFVWVVANDDNRVMDGADIRYEFCAVHAIDPAKHRDWAELGCSVLEMLVGLARRCAFEADGTPAEWFWRMVSNLPLPPCTDEDYGPNTARIVNETLDALIWRTYQPNGVGGLFPLQDPEFDQRNVELWYQLNAYLIEQG